MRSYDEFYGFLPEEKPRSGEFPYHASRIQIERWAREERARALGEFLAEAIVWAFRLPGRLIAAMRRRDIAPRAGATRNA
jgi:hypothetical protein